MSFLMFAPTKRNGRLQPVPASRVGELLKAHRVPCAVLNACESAKSGNGVDANMAEMFTSHGVSNVLGMSFQFLSSAISIFAGTFYRSFIVDSKSFSQASSEARRALRSDASREARFGVRISVSDWFVPVTYSTADGIRPHLSNASSTSVEAQLFHMASYMPDAVIPDLESLTGRQYDILRLENQMMDTNVVAIGGRAGAGKSSLLQYLTFVWGKTKFADNVVYLDANFVSSGGPEALLSMAVSKIFHLFGVGPLNLGDCSTEHLLSSNEMEALEKLLHDKRTSTILILDNLDNAFRFIEDPDLVDARGVFRQAFDRLLDIAARAPSVSNSRRTMSMILSTRWNVERWRSASNLSIAFIPLQGLRLSDALRLGQRILQVSGIKNSTLAIRDRDALEDIVNLLDRLPAALSIVLPQAGKSGLSLADFYTMFLYGRLESTIELVPNDEEYLFAIKSSTFLSTLIPMLEMSLLSNLFRIPGSIVLRIMHSLSVFWSEGPEWVRYCDLLIQTGVLQGIESTSSTSERDFTEKYGHILWHLKDLDALEYDGTRITWIHPLLTICLREMAQNSDNAHHRRLQDVIDPSIWKGFFAELLHGVLHQRKDQKSGNLTVAALAELSKRGKQNLLLCLEACIWTPLQPNEWPLQYFSSWAGLYRFTMNIHEQSNFLTCLSRALAKLLEFVEPADSPNLRNFLLVWTILFWIYEIVRPNISWNGNQKHDEIAIRHLGIARDVIKRSKEWCGDLKLIRRAVARIYRLEAVLLLSHGRLDDAQRVWSDQNEIEDQLYGTPKDSDFTRLHPGHLRAKSRPQALLQFRRFLWCQMVKLITDPMGQDGMEVPREFFALLVDTTSKEWEDMLPVIERMGYLPPNMSSQSAVNSFYSGYRSDPDQVLKRLEEYLKDGNTEKALSAHQTLLEIAVRKRDWRQVYKHTDIMLSSWPDLSTAPAKYYELHCMAALSALRFGDSRLAIAHFAKSVNIGMDDAMVHEAENFLNADPLSLLKHGLAVVKSKSRTGRYRFSIAIAVWFWLRCDAESADLALESLSPFLRASADIIRELFIDIVRRCFLVSFSSFLDLQIVETGRIFKEIEYIVFCSTCKSQRINPLEHNWIYFDDSIWPLYFSWVSDLNTLSV